MKSVVTAIQQRDSTALQAMASLPQKRQSQDLTQEAAQVFNSLFKQLRATFPAAMANFREQSDLDEFRRQWVLSFAENGIHTMDQVNAGMRIARKQESPFIPSPGQFVQWCKQGDLIAAGLPEPEELYDIFRKYCSVRGWGEFEWPSNASYWMVTKIHSEMMNNNLTDSEVKKLCIKELKAMSARINSGENIPAPILQIPKLHTPTSKDKSLSFLAEIKAKLKNKPQII